MLIAALAVTVVVAVAAGNAVAFASWSRRVPGGPPHKTFDLVTEKSPRLNRGGFFMWAAAASLLFLDRSAGVGYRKAWRNRPLAAYLMVHNTE